MTPVVDISEAVKALDLPEAPEIVPANLNDGLPPELANLLLDGVTGAQASPTDHTVKVDWDAIRWNARNGNESKYSDPAEVIAHELIHVAQFTRFPSPEAANRAYRIANRHGYAQNKYEREAFDRAPTIAPLVKVEGFDA